MRFQAFVTMSRLKLVALPLDDDDKSTAHASGLRGESVSDERAGGYNIRDGELYDRGAGDPNDSTLVAVVQHFGILRTIRVTPGGSKVRRFQFQTSKDGVSTPTGRPWWEFAFIPGQPGAILVVQAESQNLLFTSLPMNESEPSLVYLLGKHSAPVTSLTVSSDGSITATGTDDGSLAIWALSDGHRVASMKAAHDGLVRAVALSGHETLVSAGRDGVVRIWNISADGSRLRMLHRLASEQLKYVISIAVTQRAPEFTVAAGSSDGCLHVWRVNLETESARLDTVLDHNKGLAVTCLSFRADEIVLALGTQEIGETIGKGTVQLFDTKDWTTVASRSLVSPCLTCNYLASATNRLLVCTPQYPPQVFEGMLIESALRRDVTTPSPIKQPMTEVEVATTAPQVTIHEGREEEFWEPPKMVNDDFDVEKELKDYMATLGVTDPDEIRRLTEAHIHAAAATKMSQTIPSEARMYPSISKKPEKVPVKRQRAPMKLDPKWLEIKDLGPKLEDLWEFRFREEQVVDTFGLHCGTLLVPQERGVEF